MFKCIFRRRFRFREVPDTGLVSVPEKPGAWHAISTVPSFDLIPENGRFPCGWVLLEAHLVRRGTDFNARLMLDLGAGFHRGPVIEPPISAKGTLHEIVWVPEGTCRMRWEPMQAPGKFEQSPIEMTEISWPERVWRMGRRVAPILFKQPRERRKRIGLTFVRAVVGLTDAYRMAGCFRRYAPTLSYDRWFERFQTMSSRDRKLIQQHMRRLKVSPSIHVLLPVTDSDREALLATCQSLANQLYQRFNVTILDPKEIMGSDLPIKLKNMGDGCRYVSADQMTSFLHQLKFMLTRFPRDYITIIPSGDRLSEHALYWVVAEVEGNPETALIYTDEDRVNENGEHIMPRFKPDWSPEHLRSTNYVGGLAVYRFGEVHLAGGIRPDDCFGNGFDLLLRLSEMIPRKSVRHVPAILYHRRCCAEVNGSHASSPSEANRCALTSHLSRLHIKADVTSLPSACFRLRYALPEPPPMVSIIVPTRDGLHLLRRSAESILSMTTYAHFELLVVDNGSVEAETLAYLSDLMDRPKVRVLRYNHPFNFSAINNFGAQHAEGDVLCLVNNDTEVITPDWIEEMMGHLTQKGVGVVGAKLYYPDGRVQHGGDAVGPGGCADHLHAMIERDAAGYCNRAIIAQELSAVTAACLMTWKRLYVELGGLDEENLKVAFNDVDYCLRVQTAGYRVVWTPHAQLYHHESASRGKDDPSGNKERTRREADYIRIRWKEHMEHDPYYNPNLNYERPDFGLSNAPRVRRPWTTSTPR